MSPRLTSGHFLSLWCWQGNRDPSWGCRDLPLGRQSLTSSHCWRTGGPAVESHNMITCSPNTCIKNILSSCRGLRTNYLGYSDKVSTIITWRVSRSLVLKLLPASNVAARLASMVSVLWLKMCSSVLHWSCKIIILLIFNNAYCQFLSSTILITLR